MEILFVEYPKCSTCQKAKKWLKNKNIKYTDRHIVDNNPTYNELKKWIQVSELDIKKWFNVTGMKYREMGLKDKLEEMSDEEKIRILASNGMLVKRPVIVSDKFVCVGFKEKEWMDMLG